MVILCIVYLERNDVFNESVSNLDIEILYVYALFEFLVICSIVRSYASAHYIFSKK